MTGRSPLLRRKRKENRKQMKMRYLWNRTASVLRIRSSETFQNMKLDVLYFLNYENYGCQGKTYKYLICTDFSEIKKIVGFPLVIFLTFYCT